MESDMILRKGEYNAEKAYEMIGRILGDRENRSLKDMTIKTDNNKSRLSFTSDGNSIQATGPGRQ